MAFSLRPLDRRRDRAGVMAIDSGFETTAVFDVDLTPRSLTLVERPLAAPRTKRYEMGDAFAPWSSWDAGWVAVDGQAGQAGDGPIVAVAAVEYEAWHARLVLWHLYVTRERRREGIGRALLARAEDHGRALGARTVWLETTAANVPGVAAYAALGYRLVGADVTTYDTLPYADEAAIYLSRSLVE